MLDILRQRGIRDQRVLEAMARVPREAFLPPHLQAAAYGDHPLPIEEHQAISQPYIVALMTQCLNLQPNDRVLEIGTGSGYAAAVLAEVAGTVWSVERHASLAESARTRLRELGYDNVQVSHRDGSQGWPEEAPFDAISVTAGADHIPPRLLEQLGLGGRLVMPVGQEGHQHLKRMTRQGTGDFLETNLGRVSFVPLIVASERNDSP